MTAWQSNVSNSPGFSIPFTKIFTFDPFLLYFSFLLISFLRYVVVIIPAAFVLSKTVGVHGVWHAFWIAEIITAVIAFILYYQLIGKSGKN